jgi:polyisoprenoid-binding protein YceI
MKIKLHLSKVSHLLAVIPLLISGISLGDNYIIDTKNSHASILFRIKHLNYSYVTGRFDNFTGDFTYAPDNLAASKVNVTVETYSINTNLADRDTQLRSADFLNAGRFPLASFVSKSIKATADNKFDITGDLTLNGVTRDIVISAKTIGAGPDPWGGYRAGFEGKTELVLADFNITPQLGQGSESVSLVINIEGIKQITAK